MGDIERDTDELVGQTVGGRYLIRRMIGQGGMGVVYEAHHVRLDKRVAIKFLLPRYAQDAEAVARFHNEARTASAIGHENIIDVTDIGDTEDGRSYIVMEYLDGCDLAEALTSAGPMDPERAVHIISQVLRGLSAAHEKNILHRDMKPENVFLTTRNHTGKDEPDFVKIMDFGISKVIAAHDSKVRLTATGTVVGTPVYMAPEQAQADPNIDQRLDLYAVGVMLFELLTGRPPFMAASYLALVTQHLHEQAPALRSIRPELPASLEVITHRALQKLPENRFNTAAEFCAALPTGEALHAAVNWDSRSTMAGEAVTSPHRGAVAAPTMHATGSFAPPSRKPWLIVAVAAVLALGMIGFALLTRGGGGSATDDQAASDDGPAVQSDDSSTSAAVRAVSPKPVIEAAASTLELGSTPEEAAVYVDDEYYGLTPVTIEKIAIGDHELRFEKNGFQSLVASKSVRAGHDESFFAALASESSGRKSTGTSRTARAGGRGDPGASTTAGSTPSTKPAAAASTDPTTKPVTKPATSTDPITKPATKPSTTGAGSKPSPYD